MGNVDGGIQPSGGCDHSVGDIIYVRFAPGDGRGKAGVASEPKQDEADRQRRSDIAIGHHLSRTLLRFGRLIGILFAVGCIIATIVLQGGMKWMTKF